MDPLPANRRSEYIWGRQSGPSAHIMKVTIFNGTPRRNGNTAELTKCIAECLRGCDVEEVFLDGLSLSGCKNCGACQKGAMEGRCSVEDDMIPLYEKFVESDAIILASPVYMWSFTAPAVAFLTRLHALYTEDHSHNFIEGKRIALAFTMGDDEFVAAQMVNSVMFFCEYFKAEYAGTMCVPFASKDQIHRHLYQEKAKDFAAALIASF